MLPAGPLPSGSQPHRSSAPRSPNARTQLNDDCVRKSIFASGAHALLEQNIQDAEEQHACPLCSRAFDTEALFREFLASLRDQLVTDNLAATQA